MNETPSLYLWAWLRCQIRHQQEMYQEHENDLAFFIGAGLTLENVRVRGIQEDMMCCLCNINTLKATLVEWEKLHQGNLSDL
jgi:hypothetical protein